MCCAKRKEWNMKRFDAYDGMCFFEGLCFFAPVALLVRTRAGVSESLFFLLQALISVTILASEIPTGILGDRIGYRNSLILSQVLQLAARGLLLTAFLLHSPVLFAVEAFVEGISISFSSGTASAYVYEVYGPELYLSKSARAGNWSTAGFILSTLAYVPLHHFFGIPGLLMATVITCALSAGCALVLQPEPRRASHDRPAAPSLGQLLAILRQPRALALMALASVFSLSGILINFFFAVKLELCGLDVSWMSPIILLYSLVNMLSKGILDRLGQKKAMLGLSCMGAAAAMTAFGLVKSAPAVVTLMLLLPLLTEIPGFLLGQQNHVFLDGFSRGENRAASLSVMNMGVSLVEVLALFASAVLSGAGIGACFVTIGAVLLVFGIGFLIIA